MPALKPKAVLITTAAVLLLMLPVKASAHPHVFLYTGLQIEFDAMGLAGVRVLWIFDEMFSNMIITEYDRNRNRHLEDTEIAAIEQGAFSYLKNHDYFTHINIGGKDFKVNYVTDFSAEIKENKLIYKFLVPCHVTAGDTYKEVKLAIYDDTYYCSVFLPKKAIAYKNLEWYDVEHRIEKNRKAAYYFDQIYPDEVTLRFKRKRG